MRNNRLFTAMAVLSLALGIGANTSSYSFMEAILLRGLPAGYGPAWRVSRIDSWTALRHD